MAFTLSFRMAMPYLPRMGTPKWQMSCGAECRCWAESADRGLHRVKESLLAVREDGGEVAETKDRNYRGSQKWARKRKGTPGKGTAKAEAWGKRTQHARRPARSLARLGWTWILREKIKLRSRVGTQLETDQSRSLDLILKQHSP